MAILFLATRLLLRLLAMLKRYLLTKDVNIFWMRSPNDTD